MMLYFFEYKKISRLVNSKLEGKNHESIFDLTRYVVDWRKCKFSKLTRNNFLPKKKFVGESSASATSLWNNSFPAKAGLSISLSSMEKTDDKTAELLFLS